MRCERVTTITTEMGFKAAFRSEAFSKYRSPRRGKHQSAPESRGRDGKGKKKILGDVMICPEQPPTDR